MLLNLSISLLMISTISIEFGVVRSEIDEYTDSGTFCRRKNAEGKICNIREGRVCRNGSCVSTCQRHGLKPCQCPSEEDRYCYLCCGNENVGCQPAHQLNIFRPNGERWERDACRWCASTPDGMPCSDKDDRRLCHHGKCVATICLGQPEGKYCDLKKEKICLDDECKNPCGGNRLICDCDEKSEVTGEVAEDRCQLCCYDFSRKKCLNALEHFGISKYHNRPIVRSELSCKGGKTCNRYGVCSASSLKFHISLILFTLILALQHSSF